MDKIVIDGGKPLFGTVEISGAKNAAVAVIPAAVMATGISVLENLPAIEDVRNICHTIEDYVILSLIVLTVEIEICPVKYYSRMLCKSIFTESCLDINHKLFFIRSEVLEICIEEVDIVPDCNLFYRTN